MPTCVPAPQRDAVGFANNPAGQDTCIETNQKTFTAQMKCESSNGRTEPVAWIFSDQCGLRQRLLQEFGFKTIHFYHDLHSRNQCQILLTEHALQKPALVWIRFAGPCAGSGNKHDALRSEHLVRIVHQQKTSNGVVVIEASERSQAWNLQAVREILEELHTSQHRWCNYETLDSADAEPCCSCIRLLTNFDMSDGSRCNCPKGLQHVHQKELKRNAAHRYATVMRNLMHLVLSSAHSQCADLPKQMPAKGQPEFNRLDMNITEDGERKAVRFSSLLTSKTVNKEIAFNPTPPSNADSSSGPNDFWIRNGKKQVIRVHAQPRTSLYRPDSSSCPVPVEMLRPSRQSKIRAVPEFHMIDQQPLIIDDTWNDSNQTEVGFAWTGTTAFEIADAKMMFPTEEAIKQKARKASGHVVKPRFKHVEQHQDDCGEDLSSITMKDAEPNDQVDEQSQQQRVHDAVCSMFSHKRHHLFGSGFFASKAAILAAVTMSMYVTSMSCVDKIEAMPTTSTNIHSMEYVFNTRSKISHDGLDCMELFGGSGTTTFVLAKHYGLRTGVNFELLCGVDLTKRDDVEYLFKYVRRNKPLVILMAPPCKGYSKWGSLNQKINPEAWKASRDLSVPLAKLCGNIAAEQLNNQRDFLIEQPQGSGLYKESEWLKILHRLYTVIFDQCMTGLKMNSPPFWPIKKPTECKASHPALLVHLQNLRCDGSHKHAHIGHWGQGDVPTAKSSETQVWPLELCERIAGGVVECITHKTENGCYFFPAEAAPEPAAEGAQPARITCPGCRGHLRKTDPKHTRDAGCKFPNVEPISWTCPGCVANRHRAHESHTNGPECQWSLARTMPEGASRERGTTHPRDGRVPASADPTGGLRLDRQSGVAGDGEPLIESFEPERLSPEEAERRRADKSESARPRRTRSEAGVQANQPPPLAIEDAPAPDDGPSSEVVPAWTKHDLGFALQQLRSIREGIVRRTLRKLHIRWFHASLKRMHTLLQAAGVSPGVLSLIPSVIDTCDVCRSWQRVGPKSVASARVPEAFNQEVQVDLLFYKDHVLLHCIDACIRWSSVIKIPNREHISILEGFATGWLKLFGPPAAVISDREGALTTDQVAEWFDKKGIHLNLRARGQHCGTVERHNDLIRRQLHLLEDQAASEGMAVSFEMILSEAVFAKNALFQLGNVSPYESLFGRTPPLLAVLHQESGEQISDRDASRIRQIAIGSMIQATAANKTAIAEATKTRRSGELLELQLGDLVEFYRKPVSKDSTGWHGPAEVVNLNSLKDGLLYVQWQGRTIAVRVQDVRRALVYASFMTQPRGPVKLFRNEVELRLNVPLRLGWIRQGSNWTECQGNAKHSDLLSAGLYIAACCMHLEGVIGFRYGTRIGNLPSIAFDDTLLLWWEPSKGGISEWYHCFMPGDKVTSIPKITGSETCSAVQFLMIDPSEVSVLRQIAPDIPNLGGAHDPDLPNMNDKTDEVIRSGRVKSLENAKDTSDQPDHDEQLVSPKSQAAAEASLHTNMSEPNLENEVVCDHQFSYEAIIGDLSYAGMPYELSPPHIFDGAGMPEIEVVHPDEMMDPPQLVIPKELCHHVVCPAFQSEHPQNMFAQAVFTYTANKPTDVVIERVNNIITRQEALEHVPECQEAMLLELMRWIKHGAWMRGKKSNAVNPLKSKWVLKWKDIGTGASKSRKVKARLVAQGFLDNQRTETYAGTSTRWSQRLLLAICVQNNWHLWSADISEAFLRGLTFQQLHEEGQELRQVELILPPGGEHLLRMIESYDDFNPDTEVLVLLKPGFGLRDAPRLWLLALKRVLSEAGAVPTNIDPQLYCLHEDGKLKLLMSIHVDDIKLCGDDTVVKRVIAILEKNFDTVKLEKDEFIHLGLHHKMMSDGSIVVDQTHYVSELKPIPEERLKTMTPDTLVDEHFKQLYMSLLGGVAWVTQTRADVAVFVGALQRKLQKPTVHDIRNLNRVLRYIKVHPLSMKFRKLDRPYRIVAISDSGFKGEDQDHLAIRSGLICLVDRDFPKLGANSVQIIEFVSKKQSRICRSTYTAEMFSALDLTGLLFNVALTLTEILTGTCSAAKLAEKHEAGALPVELDLAIDAASVYDGVTAAEHKIPHDSTMTIHSLKLRELLARGQLSRILWVDTRAMLADGLNKGSIDRKMLRLAVEEAVWNIDQETKIYRSRMPEQSSQRTT